MTISALSHAFGLNLKCREKMVLMVLGDKAKPGGVGNISIVELGATAGLPKQEVRSAIQCLMKHKHLFVLDADDNGMTFKVSE